MGQVPLLTREQEVEISKRIETAELQGPGGALPGFGGRAGTSPPSGPSCSTARSASTASSSTRRSRAATPTSRACPSWSRPPRRRSSGWPRPGTRALKARTDADRKKHPVQVQEARAALRANFPKFYFKLKVYEEYLDQLWPVLEEIETLHAPARAGEASEDQEGRRDRPEGDRQPAAPDRGRAADRPAASCWTSSARRRSTSARRTRRRPRWSRPICAW